jgi:hypothetical protein
LRVVACRVAAWLDLRPSVLVVVEDDWVVGAPATAVDRLLGFSRASTGTRANLAGAEMDTSAARGEAPVRDETVVPSPPGATT